MALLKTGAAACGVALAVVSVVPRASRDTQADAVRIAVLETALAESRGRVPPPVVCVEIWTGPVWMNRPGRAIDPNPGVMAQLKATRPWVYPQSECEATDNGVRHRPTGSSAVILGLAAPDWVSPDFVRIQGGWFSDGLSAVGWRYTVSFHDNRWTVDTAKFLWVS